MMTSAAVSAAQALFIRLQRDEHVAAILLPPPPGPPPPTNDITFSTPGSCCTIAAELSDPRLHRIERHILLSADHTSNATRILLRKKPFGTRSIEIDVEDERHNRDREHQTLRD